ncbi:Cytokinin dehydrogenase 6 [Striga hermonthica]|uniref:Cytokinin dehydrogenase 6 n=1 Tax=Striga hermonthica TaxID=68872 RepID=A0A9N7RFS9_STRHE|nr:Cytokinin dehydrogenase 6 [Striga hermonthica]
MAAWDPLENTFHYDNASLEKASKDYGNIVQLKPNSVFGPNYVSDIQFFIKQKYKHYDTDKNKSIAIRACGHSTRGQSQVLAVIVVNMTAIKNFKGSRINIGKNHMGYYADVGCELQWIDILKDTLKVNLTPVSFTDYIHASVGGTLSNGGISGQSFQHGPQISNVYSLYAITGNI